MLAALVQNHGKLWHSSRSAGALKHRHPPPLISKVYFGHRIGPQGPLPPSYLHLTNCTLSHNTLLAFNYCLEVSRSGVTHSSGSSFVCMCVSHMCVRDGLDSDGQKVLCVAARALRGGLNSAGTLSDTVDLQLHQPLWPVLGVQMAREEETLGECVGGVIASV